MRTDNGHGHLVCTDESARSYIAASVFAHGIVQASLLLTSSS